MKQRFHSVFPLLLSVLLTTGCTGAEAQRGTEYVSETVIASAENIAEEAPEPVASEEASAADTSGDAVPSDISYAPEDIVEPEIELTSSESAPVVDMSEKEDDRLNLVFIGDSQFDNGREHGTSIPQLVGELMDADVYNLGCGGTSAANARDSKHTSNKDWVTPNFIGIANCLAGNVSTSIFDGYAAADVIDKVNPDKVDYYIIEYGMNDYLNGLDTYNKDESDSPISYVGALRIGLRILRKISPNARFLICSPSYALFYSPDGAFIGDSNIVSKGQGPLKSYANHSENIANEFDCLFLDTYYGGAFDLNTYTADEYLRDGVHYTAKGRLVYATAIARILFHDLDRFPEDFPYTDMEEILQIENFEAPEHRF